MDMSDKPEGYKFGRPTEYRPHMCEQVIEWGRQGKSKTWMAAELDIDRKTIDRWDAANPDFSLALARAKVLEQRWWEDKGQENINAQVFQSSMWSRSMSARFPDEWREKVGHVGGNKDDQPIQQEIKFGADAFTRSIVSQHARNKDEGGSGGD